MSTGLTVNPDARTMERDELRAKGYTITNPYEEAIARNLEFMGTPHSSWTAVEISGFADTHDDKGEPVRMPIFAFPAGYTSAPSLYTASSGQGCCGLCGHDIRTHYWIQNDVRKWLLPVGSECVTHFSEDAKSGKQLAKEVQWEQNREFLRKAEAVRDEISAVFTVRRLIGYGRTEIAWVNGEARNLYLEMKKLIGKARADNDMMFREASGDGPISAWVKRKGNAVRDVTGKVDAFLSQATIRAFVTAHYKKKLAGVDLILTSGKHTDGTPLTEQSRRWNEGIRKHASARIATLTKL